MGVAHTMAPCLVGIGLIQYHQCMWKRMVQLQISRNEFVEMNYQGMNPPLLLCILNTVHYTEVHFARFFSSGFTTMAVINQLEKNWQNTPQLCVLCYCDNYLPNVELTWVPTQGWLLNLSILLKEKFHISLEKVCGVNLNPLSIHRECPGVTLGNSSQRYQSCHLTQQHIIPREIVSVNFLLLSSPNVVRHHLGTDILLSYQ